MERSAGLHWPPLHQVVDRMVLAGDPLILIVSPFVKLEALKRLLHEVPASPACPVVCRWQPIDLVSGVSDLEVYEFLEAKGWDLFVNPRIHMKLYVFESNAALATSGNLTLKGLGYLDPAVANVEVGTTVDLTAQDWVNLYRVIGESRRITPDLYERYREYVKSQPSPKPVEAPPDLLGPPKKFTLASFPATETPQALAAFYFSMPTDGLTADVSRRAYHDLATFGIGAGLSRDGFERALGDSWRQNPFVQEFLVYLRAQGSLRFGAVNAWIHEKCEDVPLPYRWEVKSSTRIFYDWLAHFVPEVTWERPNHSQVIFWNHTDK